MKKTQEIIGLPIISISDGIEVGRVKNIITNAAKGAIDYVVVDSGIQILSAKIIPTVNILGIGEYAVTIENEEAINDLSKIPAAIDLLQKNIQVTGTKVLTKKGRLIGEVGDIYVDENDSCNILGLEYIADITHKKIRIIPRASVITFGKNLVVVIEDVEGTLLDKPGDLGTNYSEQEIEKKNLKTDEYNNYNYNNGNDTAESIVIETDKLIAAEGNSLFKEIDTSFQNQQPELNMFMASESTGFPLAQNDEDDAYVASLDSGSSIEGVQDLNDDADNTLVQDYYSDDEKSLSENTMEALDNIDSVETSENSDVVAALEKTEKDLKDHNNKSGNAKTANTSSGQSNAASLFEQRQKQYLSGRKATKTITSNSGAVIISEGSVITDDVIENAKENGKLIELVMNNKS